MSPWMHLPIALAWTLFTKAPVAWAMNRNERGYDNRNPRIQQAALTGWGARALASHQNAMEAFAPFAAGLIAAIVGGVDPGTIHGLAVVWLVARGAYVALYLGDVHWARTLAWGLAVASVFGLMILPALPA